LYLYRESLLKIPPGFFSFPLFSFCNAAAVCFVDVAFFSFLLMKDMRAGRLCVTHQVMTTTTTTTLNHQRGGKGKNKQRYDDTASSGRYRKRQPGSTIHASEYVRAQRLNLFRDNPSCFYRATGGG
jgi:hypothetical protein